MSRHEDLEANASHSFPRVSGDEPLCVWMSENAPTSFPRVSGDEPFFRLFTGFALRFSPRERG